MGERCSARLRQVSKLVKANKPAVSVRIGAALGLAAMLAAAPAEAGRLVKHASGFFPGAIVINQSARTLYLILGDRTAIAYPVAVAKQGVGRFGARPGQIR